MSDEAVSPLTKPEYAGVMVGNGPAVGHARARGRDRQRGGGNCEVVCSTRVGDGVVGGVGARESRPAARRAHQVVAACGQARTDGLESQDADKGAAQPRRVHRDARGGTVGAREARYPPINLGARHRDIDRDGIDREVVRGARVDDGVVGGVGAGEDRPAARRGRQGVAPRRQGGADRRGGAHRGAGDPACVDGDAEGRSSGAGVVGRPRKGRGSTEGLGARHHHGERDAREPGRQLRRHGRPEAGCHVVPGHGRVLATVGCVVVVVTRGDVVEIGAGRLLRQQVQRRVQGAVAGSVAIGRGGHGEDGRP